MVFLHQISSRQRPPATAGAPSDGISYVAPPKTSSSSTNNIINTATTKKSKASGKEGENADFVLIDKMISLLAEAGVTLHNPGGPPCLPSDLHKLRRLLEQRFSSEDSLLSDFLSGLNAYTCNPENFRRVLISASRDGSSRSESLVRGLLLVAPLQLKLQQMLLEKLPEYFDVDMSCAASLEDDVPRLILTQFRWLDFLVDSEGFTDKLLEVLSICPLQLKKEIIGSLPEIVGDQNNKKLVAALEQMLQEDSAVVVSVLDSFSNLHLDDQLQEQVITISLSCIRTIDAEHMPYLLRFLMLSATPRNVRRIISQIREQLKFVGVPDSRSVRGKKLKGKALVDNTESLILEALRSSLRFKNLLCQEILKELKCLDKAKDHKVIDVWLLMLIYTSGGSLQKSVVKIIKTKIIEGCFKEALFDQCIDGHMDLVQILGALVTHVGSAVGYEVSSALDTMVLLASKYAEELIPLSSYINGMLDYLEGFNIEKLHKVYEVFSYLVLSARSSADSVGSSIVNELLMIIRKQVSNPDLKYKKMGLIGTLKIVSCLGNAENSNFPSSQKTNFEDALELLKASMDSCKSLSLPLILFYDELIALLENTPLHPAVMEWIGKHVGMFESMFLSDLEGGQLPVKDSYCGLEGELWMNLDGDLSPICLNILPLVSSSTQSTSSIQILPANFLLLSVVERLTNQGSLGGIDALLGCPIILPSPKYFGGHGWLSLTGKQKQALCLSLYYAISWIRELLNAFSTQVAGRINGTSQATREEIIAKLLKRLRNLVFLERLLNTSLKLYPVNLPELHLSVEHPESSFLNKRNHLQNMEKKNDQNKMCERDSSNNKKKQRTKMKAAENSDLNGKLWQPTILDVLKKSGAVTTQQVQNEVSSSLSHMEKASQRGEHTIETNEPAVVEISAVAKVLNAQRFKFRPLLVDCLSILTLAKNEDSCCADPAAQLPLHLYLLHDLHYKLDYLTTPSKQFPLGGLRAPAGLSRMTVSEFVSKIRALFPSLRKHFDAALFILKEGAETCQEHWSTQSTGAGNPDIPDLVVSNSTVAGSVFREILRCFSKILNLPDIQTDKAVLSDLLGAFQPVKVRYSLLSSIQPIPSPGNIDYLYCGAYSFLEDILESDLSFSFSITSEVLVTLESIVTSVTLHDKLREGKGKHTHIQSVQGVLPAFSKRLGGSAQKLLMHQQENENLENGWRNKGEIIQKILQIYLKNSASNSDPLDELACSILPQVPSSKTKTTQDTVHSFPTLCPATFVVWYRVLHEENLAVLHKLVKEVVMLEKHRGDVQLETVKGLLMRLRQSVNVVVSLVNMCRTHEKVTVHAMAVKYGGKFIDSFLKVFDFLQTYFRAHDDTIIQLVKELQKATRTIQTLCSEAKGLKQTSITTKIPATKRSLERFLFQVKSLLHNTSNGCSFWMGNLKHKDLSGQVVSSQLFADEEDDNNEEDPEHMEADVDNQSSEGDGEAESSA
ncbi:Fanconi anemia group D2 protein homolog isoform X2 [Macadamia integrifolia]|uniref:Fanconi anemia group D2 protein homolog isoform X2 n=1 Tax=Macadamia integrifolia TaxID=60698 RepID=UPI001C5274B1|nr:Fanconi anemia group D2 protein homolog isoform X2 [Macadamia integrifolia]